MSDLENTLNQQYDNVISNFKSEYPKIKAMFRGIALPALCRIFTATNKRHYQ